MNIKILRKLARDSKYQQIYNNAKELNCFRLFYNDMDLSWIQMLFLYWLGVYSSLYMDLAMNKKHLSEEVIEDEVRTDAYLLWKSEEEKKEDKELASGASPENNTGIPRVVFTKKGE